MIEKCIAVLGNVLYLSSVRPLFGFSFCHTWECCPVVWSIAAEEPADWTKQSSHSSSSFSAKVCEHQVNFGISNVVLVFHHLPCKCIVNGSFKASMNKRNDYSKQCMFWCSRVYLPIVLQTWKMLNLLFKWAQWLCICVRQLTAHHIH